MYDQDPLVSGTIRRRVDAFTGPDHYRFTIDGIEYDAHWAHDTRRLLDENARLNTEMAARDRTVEALSARLTAKNAELDECIRAMRAAGVELEARNNEITRMGKEIVKANEAFAAINRIIEPRDPNWKPLSERYPQYFKAVSDVERARRNGWDQGVSLMSQRIKAVLDGPTAAPEMPRPPAEGLAAKLDALQSELDALKARRDAPAETSREYLRRMGAEFRSNMARLKARDEAEAERDRLAAQEPVSGPETAGTGSGRGTGVTEAPGTAQAYEDGRRIAVSMMDRAEAKHRHGLGQPHLREHCETCAEEYWHARLLPDHYQEAAASLRAFAAANRDVQSEAYINGIESAAGRLDSFARDDAPSLPVPSATDYRHEPEGA